MYRSAALRKEEYYTYTFEIASLPHFHVALKDPSKPLVTFSFSLLCGSLICCLFLCCFLFFSWQASPTDEAIALLLFEWAVSKYRVGKFRALAVAKVLQRRQTELLEEVRLLESFVYGFSFFLFESKIIFHVLHPWG